MVVDPGVATGMGYWEDGSAGFWQEDDPIAVVDTVAANAHRGLDAVVVEDFHLGAVGRAKTTAGIRATIELIGMLRYVAAREGVTFVLQSPSDAASFSTRDKLDKAGFVTPSKPDHARSASRHLLLYLVRQGAIDGASLIP